MMSARVNGRGAGTWYASRCSKLPMAGQGTFSQLATFLRAVLTRASYQRTLGKRSGFLLPKP